MGIWSDIAAWRGPTPNKGGAMSEHRGCVVHIAEGFYEGTIAWQRNDSSNVSSHFIVGRTGAIAQMVDTDTVAWTQSAGNGHWLSIENEGFTPASVHYRAGWEILTPQQVEANAKILAKGHLVYGYPLQLAVDPNGRGLGHHSMGCRWPGGAWGHCDCPGPAIIGQKQQVLDRARQIVKGDNDMVRVVRDTAGQGWLGDGVWRREATSAECADWVAVGAPNDGVTNRIGNYGADIGQIEAVQPAPVDVEALAAVLGPMLDAAAERAVRRVMLDAGTPDGTGITGS